MQDVSFLYLFLCQGYRTYLRAHTLPLFSIVPWYTVIWCGTCLSFRFAGQPNPSILPSLYHSPYSNLLVASECGHACLLYRPWRFEFMFLSLCSKNPHPLSNIFSAKIWNFSRKFGNQYYPLLMFTMKREKVLTQTQPQSHFSEICLFICSQYFRVSCHLRLKKYFVQ